MSLIHPRFPDGLDEIGVVQVGLPVPVGEVRDDAVKQMLLQFESLGEDCEFGLVQRRYAAEGLSLIRWMTMSAATLIDLLERRFEGLGEPSQMCIDVAPWGELMALHPALGLRMHTFVHSAGVDIERFAANQSRRTVFLKRKLLEDLAEHRKIFVVQAGCAMTDDLGRDVAAALRRYGPNVLLAVGLATGDHPSGTVRVHGHGLLRGYIDRRGKTAVPTGGHRWNINFDAWVSLCRRSTELVAEGFGR